MITHQNIYLLVVWLGLGTHYPRSTIISKFEKASLSIVSWFTSGKFHYKFPMGEAGEPNGRSQEPLVPIVGLIFGPMGHFLPPHTCFSYASATNSQTGVNP